MAIQVAHVLIDPFLDKSDIRYTLRLHFGGCRIEVASNETEVIRALKDYFGPFVDRYPIQPDIVVTAKEMPAPKIPFQLIEKPPDPGKIKVKEEYRDDPPYRIVRKRLTGMVFMFGNKQNLAMGPCMKNLNQIVNFVNNRYIEWKLCQGCLLGHAAGVVLNGKGLALAGFSGSGKSTLALHLMNRGAMFVSNDRLMIEKKPSNASEYLIMHGVAKLPRINPGTVLNNPNLVGIMPEQDRERFSSLSKEELWRIEHKYDAPIDKCFGPRRFVLSSPMTGLVILNRRPSAGVMSLESVAIEQRTDLLPAFIKSVGLFFMPSQTCRMPEPSEENYINYLSKCRIWEITGDIDFDRAADACISLLEGG